jgi:methionyl aminopeptidase
MQLVVEDAGFGVVRDFCGHGVGRELHEPPSVPNYADSLSRRAAAQDFTLSPGLVIAVEPMVTAGTCRVMQATPGRWPVVTKDGCRAVHFEHTIAITRDGAVVLSG